jgi:multiple sugar transport system permease protein
MPRGLLGDRERRSPAVRLGFGFATAVVALMGCATLAPFAWMLLTAVRPAGELFASPARLWPESWGLSAFVDALERLPLARYLWNSVLVSGVSALGQLALAAPAAWGLAHMRSRFKPLWTLLLAASLLVPVETLVVPLFLEMRAFPLGGRSGWNLLDSPAALILPGLVSAFALFTLKAFLGRFPREIRDSARLDGCSEWGVFLRFVLPMSRSILTVLGLFGFIAAWNAFFWPLVAVSDPAHYTLVLGVQKLLESGEPWNVVMAASALSVLPSLALFMTLQGTLARGLDLSGYFP